MRPYETDWSDAKIAKLRELWHAGLSSIKIGRELGVSKNAVVGKTHRLNLPRRANPVSNPGAYPRQRKQVTRIARHYVPSATPPKLPSVSRLASIGIGRYDAPVAQVPAASQQLVSSPDRLEAPAPCNEPAGASFFQPRGECQWIEGDVGIGITPVFCGARVWRRSYCRAHFDVCYTIRRACEAAA